MSYPSHATPAGETWLCLDEYDAEHYCSSERCATQCDECREREEQEKYGLPEGD